MKRQVFVIGVGILSLVVVTRGQSTGKVYELKSSPATVSYGFYDASIKPVLTINSGDRVRLWTTTGNPKYFEGLGVPKEKIPQELYAAFEGVQDNGRGDHTLVGPIFVNGAEPGDAIEIRIISVDLWLPIGANELPPETVACCLKIFLIRKIA